MILNLEKGFQISVNVIQTNGIVLARSAFHHSLNYQSVTIFGEAKLVLDEEERYNALKVISDQIIPDRWEEVRLPNAIEMKGTKVIKIPIAEASAKIRTGPPSDDKADYELPIWAGVIPMKTTFGDPVSDTNLTVEVPVSKSALNLVKNQSK